MDTSDKLSLDEISQPDIESQPINHNILDAHDKLSHIV